MARQTIPLDVLVNRLGELDEEDRAVVGDFVEFLCQRKRKKGKGLLEYLRERALPSVSLEQVRADLATITGSLSEVVTQMRQERG
jgi:hypothetical protein